MGRELGKRGVDAFRKLRRGLYRETPSSALVTPIRCGVRLAYPTSDIECPSDTRDLCAQGVLRTSTLPEVCISFAKDIRASLSSSPSQSEARASPEVRHPTIQKDVARDLLKRCEETLRAACRRGSNESNSPEKVNGMTLQI